MLATLSVVGISADRTFYIKEGLTMINPAPVLGLSDTVDVSDTVTFSITNLQKYYQHQSFTVGLTTVSGSPSVVITAYGKITASAEWVQIGSPITWTTVANNGTISSVNPANYNYLKVVFISSAAAQKTKITTFEAKTANVYSIPSSSGSLTITGATTLSGGLNLPSEPSIFWAAGGSTVLATSGTDVACANGTRFWVELNIPYNCTITGLAYLVGSVGGTDSVVVQLCNSSGVQVATSRVVGGAATLVGTAAQFQSVAFTSPYTAVSGRYFAVVQFNGTTAKFRAYPIPGSKFIANTAAGTWGTKADITPGTSFIADKAPILQTY